MLAKCIRTHTKVLVKDAESRESCVSTNWTENLHHTARNRNHAYLPEMIQYFSPYQKKCPLGGVAKLGSSNDSVLSVSKPPYTKDAIGGYGI